MNADISTLLAEARNTIVIVKQNKDFYIKFKQVDYPVLGQSTISGYTDLWSGILEIEDFGT